MHRSTTGTHLQRSRLSHCSRQLGGSLPPLLPSLPDLGLGSFSTPALLLEMLLGLTQLCFQLLSESHVMVVCMCVCVLVRCWEAS